MEKMIHRSGSRGKSDLNWLVSRHTFSFGGYYCPERIHFGALRVLNDDRVEPGMGFGTHPHDNMEIISIPLKGTLEHKDSMGHSSQIRVGDVQVMSAGTGIQHSEFNPSIKEEVQFLQIWIFPNQKNVEPRYQQCSFDNGELNGGFQLLVGPKSQREALWIHQDAFISQGKFSEGQTMEYSLQKMGNGVYFFIINGNVQIEGTEFNERDGVGISGERIVKIEAISDTRILAIEVPLH